MSADPPLDPDATASHDATVRMMEDLRVLSVPRASGTEAEVRARAWVSRRLGDIGWPVTEERFEYDHRLIRTGYPLVLAVAAASLTLGPVTGMVAFSVAGLALLAGAAWVVGANPRWLYAGDSIPSANVIAQSAAETVPPAIVIMAHVDSKSQRLSFVGRTLWSAAAFVLVVAAVATMFLGVSQIVQLVAAAIAAGSLVVLASAGWGNASPGALDNGSGVVVLLDLARRLADRSLQGEVALVVTGAEEDGLVGASHWIAHHGARLAEAGSVVINLDTVGGRGRCILTGHVRGPGPPGTARMWDAFIDVAREMNAPLSRQRVPFPGGVDSFAVARAGVAAVTLASGTVRSTFRHVHRPSDRVEQVDAASLERAADLVERVTRRLLSAR